MTAPSEDFTSALARTPLLQDLPEAVVKDICEFCDRRSYTAGQTVYSMGQYDGAEFFVVLSGHMRATLMDAESGAMMIEEFGPDGVFAMELAFSQADQELFQQISITAEDDLTLIAIDAEAFRALAAKKPSLMRNIAQHVAQELSSRRFKNITGEIAPERRVYMVLLKHVERDAMSGGFCIKRMPKHRELADEAGVEESFAANAVATLIQEGVARREYPGLLIDDMSRLNQLAS